ncbi:MAG TPA: (Fe-S)-binding protein [Anaerolineae bacterium]|nr:(Fe-S)-binding protein [Anaerolineae bacterium]
MSSVLSQTVPGQQVFGPELPDYDALQACIRCGRCLPVCPTYQDTTLETQSPRGRLSLLRAVENGKLDLSGGVGVHLYHCLDCRACNVVCPSGVRIGELILQGRAAYAEQAGRPWWAKIALDRFLTSARSLEPVMKLARLYQRTGLQMIVRPLLSRLARRFPRLLPLAYMEELLPQLSEPLHTQLSEVIPAKGEQRHRVGFFLGCMMSQVLPEVSRATVEVLTHNGCEVVVPPHQVCCGAPHEDQGNKRLARDLARRNVDVFARYQDLDVIVSDCAACAGMIKEYGHLLHEDLAYAEKAAAMSARMRDVTEWLAEIIDGETLAGALARRATYHAPCHQANVQGIVQQPIRVLQQVPGLDFVPLPDATRCCGSAGIYNLTHPEMADRLLEDKLNNVASTGADLLVSSNPGCLLQLQMGVRERGMKVEVRHLTEVLAEVYRGSE